MADAKTKVEHILDQDRIPTWPPMKKAVWDAVIAEKLNDGHYINAYALTDKLYAAAISAAPQPAASDVAHDVVRALEIAELLREADAHIVWEANGLGNDFADRVEAALAAPAPSTSTEPSLDDWAYAFANWRQGQRSTPSCEAPGEADIRICRDLIKGMLACRPSAPSTSTEEALRAENARLREALTKHHAWHLASEPDAEGVGGAEAYCESSLFDLTTTALSALSR